MAGISSSPQTGQSVFSLDTQAGVMNLLASIRASNLSAADKNELRDLVFLYTNGGHDQSVRISLENKLRDHQVTPVASSAKTASQTSQKERPTIGTFRNAPSFTVSTTTQPITKSEPALQPVPESVSETNFVTPIEKPANPAPSAAPAEPLPNKTPVTVQSANEQPSADGDALERIKVIKSEVNEKVGNPVHLVDLDPDLGREYMSALLEAMKKVNSGSKATEAMVRLEAARGKIVNSSFSKTTPAPKEETRTTPPIATPQKASEPAAVDVKSASSRASLLDEVETESPKETGAVVSSKPAEPARSFAPPVVDTPTYHSNTTPERSTNPVPVTQNRETTSNVVPITSSPRPTFATESKEESTSRKVTNPLGEAAPPNQPPVSPIASFSSPLIKGKSDSEAAVGSDSLHTPEVDAGLGQLLEEWPIFKKSGLFGTGPKGREHPLFKKVAGLQIPLLLAGRFEGATQEIKQSITDYMNGWRYEQGLIYEQGETFEHYLRRVIRHILDLQKSKI